MKIALCILRPRNHIKLFENDAIALKTITVVGTLATTLGTNNPFHYRGYYRSHRIDMEDVL